MFPIAPALVIFAMAAAALLGAILGVLVGAVASNSLNLLKWGVWKDGLLGVIGFLAGFSLANYLLWQHPFLVGYIASVILPVIRHAFRGKETKSEPN